MRAIKVYGSLFVGTGVPFGVGMGLLSTVLFDLSTTEGLLLGLSVGAFFGGVVALVLGTVQVAGNRGAPRGASLGPRQTRDVLVVNSPDLADRIVAALRSLPAEVTAVDVPAGRYAAKRAASWKSWGEDVVVQLSGDPARPMATVSSRPRLGTTLIDYGRGRGNVEHVVGALPTAQQTHP